MAQLEKKLGKIDSLLLVGYIADKCGQMSHLKAQKLLFYIQAFHLACFHGEPIIDDEFEAWVHGPVSRKVYLELCKIGGLYDLLDLSSENGNAHNELEKALLKDQIDVINDVLDNYSPLTGSQLEYLTHTEQPWMNARKGLDIGDRSQNIIDRKDMENYYGSLLY